MRKGAERHAGIRYLKPKLIALDSYSRRGVRLRASASAQASAAGGWDRSVRPGYLFERLSRECAGGLGDAAGNLLPGFALEDLHRDQRLEGDGRRYQRAEVVQGQAGLDPGHVPGTLPRSGRPQWTRRTGRTAGAGWPDRSGRPGRVPGAGGPRWCRWGNGCHRSVVGHDRSDRCDGRHWSVRYDRSNGCHWLDRCNRRDWRDRSYRCDRRSRASGYPRADRGNRRNRTNRP